MSMATAAIPSAAMELAREAARQATERTREQQRIHRANDMRWYLLQCGIKSDRYVQDWLDDRDFETYYPQVREMRPVPRKQLSKAQRDSGVEIKRPQIVPFFPRYMFVRFDIQGGLWRTIFGLAGVVGLHCAGDIPAPISDDLIDELKGREIDGAVPGRTPIRLIFKLGETVKVVDGPFASFYATVEKLPDVPVEEIDPDTRIKVAVNIFGRLTPVELEVDQIEKV